MRLQTEAEIRAEADKLLSSGLRETLESYGEVHVVGSYRMRLMGRAVMRTETLKV